MPRMIRPELMLFADLPSSTGTRPAWLDSYSGDTAIAIQSCLIRAYADLVAGGWPDTVSLYCSPAVAEPLFQELSDEHGFALYPQRPGDPGARMVAALAEGLARAGSAAVMTMQAVPPDWDVLDDANLWIARGRHALGMTERGGIYLLCLASLPPGLFDGIDWAAPAPGEQLIRHAATLGLEFEPLPRLRALQTPNDLWLLAQRLPSLRPFLGA